MFQLLNPGKLEQLSARYDGNWKRGEKHGEGTYFFPNGDRYEGIWLKGKQHGKGTYFFSGNYRNVYWIFYRIRVCPFSSKFMSLKPNPGNTNCKRN